jgi:hypothetical protein
MILKISPTEMPCRHPDQAVRAIGAMRAAYVVKEAGDGNSQ